MRAKYGKILMIGCICCSIAIALIFFSPQRRIYRYVNQNSAALTSYAESRLNGENAEKTFDGIGAELVVHELEMTSEGGVSYAETRRTVEFLYFQIGIVPVTKYYGFYYSPEDLVFAYEKSNDVSLKASGDEKWTWSYGGHSGVVSKICDGWYYFESTL